ncbi:c-type cytochrome [Thiohalomonas denitrificans]|uniref:c-type cytochrome n=1 Tax=Thiohalomonas denitrificans TaxID=415747 RepID=UPI0026EFFB27|nr:c-type cytochrome [Thiohalomonas denitrificans]
MIAEPVERFDAWLARQRQPVSAPVDEPVHRGREHFSRIGCADCHTIRGTPARGDEGPDLTHVASRRTIAAGTLPMSRENLARWISASQRVKPGNRMEDFSHLDDVVVRDLAAYLHSLE